MNIICHGIALGIAGTGGALLVYTHGLADLLALPVFLLASIVISVGERS